MSSGQSTESIIEATQPSEPRAAPSGAGPDPLRELRDFLCGLLETQCALIGAVAGVVYVGAAGQRRPGVLAQFQVAAADGQNAVNVLVPQVVARLERLGAEVAGGDASARGKIETIALPRGAAMYGEEARHRLVSVPLAAEGRVEGASVLVLPARATVSDDEALRLLALTSARFEAFLWRRQCLSEAEQKIMLRETIELLDASQQGGSAGTMGAIMCNELKRRFGCTRVSIGLVEREFIRLKAVTGSDELDRRAPAVESLEATMEECAAQDIEVVFPQPLAADADPALRRVTRAHEDLNRKFGPSAILSLPLRVEGDLVGVVVLEREAGDPFPVGAAALLRLVAETIGPALWTRRLADRGVFAVTRDRLIDLGAAIVGPRHTGAKLLGLLVLVTLLLAAFMPIPSRVSADAEVRAAVTRTVVPPFTGYLATVLVKPGDGVEEGQVLATMETSDLALQIAEVAAHVGSLETQRDEALEKGELAKQRELESHVKEKSATLSLLRDHLARASIRSPISGLVGRGELDQFVQARVDPTQPLFEIVSPDEVAVVFVDERDVQRVRVGQEGALVIKALPGERVGARVKRIDPAADVVKGNNVYRVEVELTAGREAPWLRPGMTGIVKLEDGWTTTLAALLRPIVDEARMRLWW